MFLLIYLFADHCKNHLHYIQCLRKSVVRKMFPIHPDDFMEINKRSYLPSSSPPVYRKPVGRAMLSILSRSWCRAHQFWIAFLVISYKMDYLKMLNQLSR